MGNLADAVISQGADRGRRHVTKLARARAKGTLWVLALLLTAEAAAAGAPWLEGYAFRRKLSVTNLSAIASDQANFPLLVKFSNSNFSFQNANTNGFDLRFTAADGTTPLAFDRERHAPSENAAEYWVRMPVLSSTATTDFYVYYTPAAKADGASSTNVWDSDYCFVHHMADVPQPYRDATAYGVTGISDRVALTAGPVGRAGGNTGVGKIALKPPAARPFSATFETWFRADALVSEKNVIACLKPGTDTGYSLSIRTNGAIRSKMHTGSAVPEVISTNVYATGGWHYVADTYSSWAGHSLYVDGERIVYTNLMVWPYEPYFTNTQIICDTFVGAMDEVRMSRNVRSGDYVRAQYASMRDRLLAYGAEEQAVQAMPWLEGYAHRLMLAVTNTAAMTANLVDFPLLVRLTPENFAFRKANADGHDVRFTLADGVTLLSYERERHDPDAERAEYWVKVPVLQAGAVTVLYLYHTREDAADGSAPQEVWDADYVFVHHMEEAAGSAFVYDSTVNGMTGTNASVTLGAAGYINGAVQGTGAAGQAVVLGNFARPSSSATVELWFKPNQAAGRDHSMFFVGGANYAYRLEVSPTSNLYSYVHNGNAEVYYNGASTLAMGAWHYAADIWSSGQGRNMYLDGVPDGSLSDKTLPYASWWVNKRILYQFNGSVDEVRFSKIARSAEWIRAQNLSMRDQLLGYGADESRWQGTMMQVR